MRIGSPARSLTKWLSHIGAVAVLTALPSLALGQAPPASHRGVPLDAYGNPPVVAHGHGGGYAHHDHQGPMPHGGFMGPYPMGTGGTCPPVGYDLMEDVGIEGPLMDQRGPHYFDARVEAVYLSRDKTFGPRVDFTSLGVAVPPNAPNIVLSSTDLDYDPELGFRVVGRFDIGALSVFEFGYMGVFDYESRASVFDPNNELFSLFSDFGLTPPTVTDPVLNPMPWTEQASRHSIAIESELHTAELTYRRYWVGFSPRISGTLLFGFRYTKLDESFVFSSVGSTEFDPPPTFDYTVRADNNMFGLQTGGDMWVGLSQGLRLGVEGKAGIFNNRYRLVNRIALDPPVAPPGPGDPQMPADILFEPERFRDDQAAFIGEASVDLVADILPSWSLRVGYEVLFINSIVLAGSNFNTVSPFGEPGQPTRVPFVHDQSSVLYHGAHAGLEFIW